MARKPMYDGGTKNKMIEVASKLFFENCFDGTSVRSIMRGVGGEIGLFYYYYKSKDDLFTDVMEHFFEPYKKDFERLVEESRQKPYQGLLRFFMYVKDEVRTFRQKYEGNMHRTVRWAIREQTQTVIEPYIEEIVNILIENGANPIMNARLTAVFLSHGVGGFLLHENSDWVDGCVDEMRGSVNAIMRFDEEITRKMIEKYENGK